MIFDKLRCFTWMFLVVLLLPSAATVGQNEGVDTLQQIGKKDLERMKLKPPLSQDTLRQLKYSKIYMQVGGVANAFTQGLIASNDLIFATQASPGTMAGKNTIGRYLPYVYSLGTGIGLNIWSRNRDILPPRTNMLVANSAVGTIIHGPMLGEIIFGPSELSQTRGAYITSAALGLVEGWAHYFYSGRRNFSYAQTMAWSTGNLWGAVIAYDLSTDISVLIDRGRPNTIAPYAGLAGSIAGVYLSNLIFRKHPRTTGDYRALNSGMIAAVLYTNGMFESTLNTGSSKWLQPAFTVAQLTSFGASFLFTRHTQFSDEEGLYIAGVAGIGGLFGWMRFNSLSRNRNASPSSNADFFIGSGMVMGWGAAYLGASILKTPTTRKRPRQSSVPKIQFNPSGIMFARLPEARQLELLQMNVSLETVQVFWTL